MSVFNKIHDFLLMRCEIVLRQNPAKYILLPLTRRVYLDDRLRVLVEMYFSEMFHVSRDDAWRMYLDGRTLV